MILLRELTAHIFFKYHCFFHLLDLYLHFIKIFLCFPDCQLFQFNYLVIFYLLRSYLIRFQNIEMEYKHTSFANFYPFYLKILHFRKIGFHSDFLLFYLQMKFHYFYLFYYYHFTGFIKNL